MFVKSLNGTRGFLMQTVKEANTQMLTEEMAEEETLLSRYQTLVDRWISRLHKSGNLREEKVSLAHHQSLAATRSMAVRSTVRGYLKCGILLNHKQGCSR